MNKSVPTLLGIVIILLVVVLAVLIVNLQMTKGLGQGGQVVGTVGGQMLTGEQPPKEVIDASTVAGSREPEPTQPMTMTPEQQQRMSENRAKGETRAEQRRETGPAGRSAPGGGTK